MRVLFWISAILLCAVPSLASAQNRDRNTMVLNDRQRVVDDGYWIYNNLDKGFEEAKKTGKPLLVVFRCIPCEACAQLDEQVVEKNPAVRKHLSNFVCVRVVYANGMDLSRFQFDYDQSWAAFFLNADGTIYGRYGTRSHQHDSEDDVSLDGFLDTMQSVLALHKQFPETRSSLIAKTGPKSEIAKPEEFAKLKEKYTSSLNYGPEVARSCIHCHQVGEAWKEHYWLEKKSVPTELIYAYPHPKIFGLIMDPAKAATVKSVAEGSLASEAGFQAGDKLVSLEKQPLVSMADIQWILHQRKDAGKISFVVSRASATKEIDLMLPENWKELGDFSWRASSWGLRRMVTGGLVFESVAEEQRKELGLESQAVGLRIKHVGQFNAHAAGKRAGFKVDDIVTQIDGIERPMTESALIAHLLRTKRPGDTVAVSLVREGKPIKLELPIQE
jgi:serine protease Do